MSIYNYSVPTKSGEEKSLQDFAGKVLVIVNTASKCGFTPQYDGLEALYKQYKEQGLEIIAIPSNQFGEQEPGTNEEVQSFCKLNFGVTFPVMAKSDVRDANQLPLFSYLTEQQPFKGFPASDLTQMLTEHLNSIDSHYLDDDQVKWNFTKFVINREGHVVARFEPMADPKDMENCIKELL